MAATLGLSKVFILDKYFSELQKYWETEKRLQDAKSNGEAENLQNRLRSLSTGLVGLRNSLQDQQQHSSNNSNHNNTTNSLEIELEQQNSIPPPPSQQNYCNVLRKSNGLSEADSPFGLEAANNQVYQPTSFEARTISAPSGVNGEQNNQKTSHRRFNAGDGMNTLRSVRSHVTEVSSVMSGNVSTQNSQEDLTQPSQFSSAQQTFDESLNLTVNSSPQHQSPPKPVETIIQQHNYINVTQPSIVHPQATRPLSGPTRNGHFGSRDRLGQLMDTVESASVTNSVNHSAGSQQPEPGAQGGAFSRSAVRPRTPPGGGSWEFDPSVRQSQQQRGRLAKMQDLIQLEPPLTEDAIMRTLQARFNNQKYFTNVGPIVLSMNPYQTWETH